MASLFRIYLVLRRWLVGLLAVAAFPGVGFAEDRDLGPLAFSVFEVCARAGFEGRQIEGPDIFDQALAEAGIARGAGLPLDEIFLGRGADFGCDVTIRGEAYDRDAFLARAEDYRLDGIPEVASRCEWETLDNPQALILTCRFSRVTHPGGDGYLFRSEFIVLAEGPALLLFFPTLKYGADGVIEVLEGGQ